VAPTTPPIPPPPPPITLLLTFGLPIDVIVLPSYVLVPGFFGPILPIPPVECITLLPQQLEVDGDVPAVPEIAVDKQLKLGFRHFNKIPSKVFGDDIDANCLKATLIADLSGSIEESSFKSDCFWFTFLEICVGNPDVKFVDEIEDEDNEDVFCVWCCCSKFPPITTDIGGGDGLVDGDIDSESEFSFLITSGFNRFSSGTRRIIGLLFEEELLSSVEIFAEERVRIPLLLTSATTDFGECADKSKNKN